MSDGNGIKFTPIYGPSRSVESTPKAAGQLFFETDTGKIYLDTDADSRKLMGGSSSGASLYYTSQGAEGDKIEESSEYIGYYILKANQLELDEEMVLSANDLIIGADGAFYRIVGRIPSGDYQCTRMLVGGGGEAMKRRYTVDLETPDPAIVINGQKVYVYFTVHSAIDQNDNILDNKFIAYLTLGEKVAGTVDQYVTYYTTQQNVDNDARSYFDITEFLRESATTGIKIYAKGVQNGTSGVYSTDITTTVLSLNNSASFSNLSLFRSDAVNLSCEAVGKMDKILTFYFDGQPVETRQLSATANETQTYKIDSSLATQGAHQVKITLSQAKAVVGGPWQPLFTLDPLEFEVAVYNSTSEDQSPIIWLGSYANEYYNYDTIQIPFKVYNPASPATAIVHLKKDGQDIAGSPRTISTEASSYVGWNIFEIADADLNMINYYSISCGATERLISFTVSQDPNRSMELVQQELLDLFDGIYDVLNSV